METSPHTDHVGSSDMFKNENDSVDLLLQEFNHDGALQVPSYNEDSPTGSPVKPLSYKMQKQLDSVDKSLLPNTDQNPQDQSRKEFNSSSDTYVSDHEDGENDAQNDSGNIDADILPSNVHPHEHEQEPAVSPSKSIMKTSIASGSPKKSVAFQPSLDTFHTYTPRDPESAPPTESATPIDHSWSEVDQSGTSHEYTLSPPAPPPHTSNTITGLLTASKERGVHEDEGDHLEPVHIQSFKNSDKGYSNLSLNEKLNVFLTSSSQSNHDDLDNHLDQLGKASQEETDVNIHRLSYHLEEYNPTSTEDPLNALSKSQQLYINSAHSSQSSLQSLIDSNRQLPADSVEKTSRGIQFNDGIKGFPDTVASSLIPMTATEEDSLSDDSSVRSQFSFSQMKAEPNRDTEESYDQSYNSTEKSIMNLLNSASHLDLPNEQHKKDTPVENNDKSLKKEELAEQSPGHQEPTSPPEKRIEVKTESSDVEVKTEPVSDAEDHASSENGHPQIKEEPFDFFHVEAPNEHSEPPSFSFPIEGLDEVKQEDDEQLSRSLLTGPTAGIKQEESLSENHQSEMEGKERIKTEKQETKVDSPSNLSDYENDSDYPHSDYEYSFSHDGHEPSTEIHTFRVDEKAVVPGPVKLVHSADNSSNTPAGVQSKPTVESKPSAVDQEDSFSDDGSKENVQTTLATEHHQASGYSSSSDSDDSDEYKDSVEYSLKSLAPPRSVVQETEVAPVHADKSVGTDQPETAITLNREISTSQDFDSSVLANSSNVNPPLDIQLPVVETDENGFADLTEKLNGTASSFEESLSAEHDIEKKSANFLSIWHSQSLGRRVTKTPAAFYKVPSISTYNTADLSQVEKYHIPRSLQPKKFTDVNVVSTRVLSSSHEDLNVSGFLPEISQDSGLEGHFRSLVRNHTTIDGDRSYSGSASLSRRRSLDSSNVLSGLEERDSSAFFGQDSSSRRRRSIHDTLRPAVGVPPHSGNETKGNTKKSRFHVPSFEIKRSSSILSPKNQYNDIFHDGSFVEPTIKSSGMKTLPSMDRDDVKRIMQMKQAMSLEEYSGLKNVGASLSSAVQQDPRDRFEGLQQRASIYCDSMASNSAAVASKFRANPKHTKESHHLTSNDPIAVDSNLNRAAEPVLIDGPMSSAMRTDTNSHVYDLLSEKPVAISELDPGLNYGDQTLRPQEQASELGPQDALQSDQFNLPEPDVNLFSIERSPEQEENQKPSLSSEGQSAQMRNFSPHNPFRSNSQVEVPKDNEPQSSVAGDDAIPGQEVQHKFAVKSWNDATPQQATSESPAKGEKSTRSSPIKINSPVKVVTQNGSVTGIVLDKKPKGSFDTKELHNRKIRTDKNHLSTVSVPSNILSEASSNTRIQSNATNEPTGALGTKSSESLNLGRPEESGKLFFRVVGLKNIEVPQIEDRNVAFNITLDNGIHCIKTPNYNLESNKVSIDKEFELSVSDSLEFILTLKATYSKMKPGYKEVRERKVVKSKNKISRLFGSKDIITTTKFVTQETEDPLDRVFATDGSFARCYVDLDSYKSQITGQAYNYNLVCFNEWATYTHNGTKVVKKPYQVAQLEVKMLYVPRSEGYEILPKSIKSAYESLDDLKREKSLSLEGYLHQEGGDCETWKRRWFELHGTSLIAHSEFSHKTRAKINLAKVTEVIYVDKENIEHSSTNYRNFSDILLMENSFKIRFANGELIDFGAPSRTEKALWIKTIQEIVCRNKFRRQSWVQLMQAKNGNRRRSWVEA